MPGRALRASGNWSLVIDVAERLDGDVATPSDAVELTAVRWAAPSSMNFDPVEICAVLVEEGVEFVVLGGFAAIIHESPAP